MGVPPSTPPGDRLKATGGMPLAFTQEDFLVCCLFYLLFFVDFGLLHYSRGIVFIVASITSSLQMATLFGSSNVFDRCWCSYIG